MELKKLLVSTTVVTFIFTIVLAVVAFYVGYETFSKGVLITTPFGMLSLFFLSKDVHNALMGNKKFFFIFRFIFRLVSFSILLYVLLVIFRLSPAGVVSGLVCPMFVFALVSVYFLPKGLGGTDK